LTQARSSCFQKNESPDIRKELLGQHTNKDSVRRCPGATFFPQKSFYSFPNRVAELRAIKFAFILKTPLAKRVRDWVDLRRKSLTQNSTKLCYHSDEYFWVFHNMGSYVSWIICPFVPGGS
jgi:hypothetical protein